MNTKQSRLKMMKTYLDRDIYDMGQCSFFVLLTSSNNYHTEFLINYQKTVYVVFSRMSTTSSVRAGTQKSVRSGTPSSGEAPARPKLTVEAKRKPPCQDKQA